jgi:hypothetical protein
MRNTFLSLSEQLKSVKTQSKQALIDPELVNEAAILEKRKTFAEVERNILAELDALLDESLKVQLTNTS